MEPEFIREYASRMSVIFADRSLKAKNSRETDDYVKYLEDRRDFWEKIAQVPVDSDQWELVKEYISLMSNPKISKTQLRREYKFLQEKICNTDLEKPRKFKGYPIAG